MNEEIYLLWSPQGWGVFNIGTCPDPHGLPSYWYKKYEVPRDREMDVFERLLEVRDRLEGERIQPSQENYHSIFPDLSKLLE